MKIDTNYNPEFESLKDLLLDMSQKRDVDIILGMLAERLAARPHIALACIWLVEPGDRCSSCSMLDECADQEKCLHLAASAGDPAAKRRVDLSRLPLGVGMIGHFAKIGGSWRKDESPNAGIDPEKHTPASRLLVAGQCQRTAKRYREGGHHLTLVSTDL